MVKKIKIGKIEMNFSDRWLYTFIALGVLILLGVVVYAVAGVSHTADELPDETDPTVIASVKDGVSWSEVSGIPADIADGDADTDNQQLSISGQILSITGGNTVTLPSESGGCYVSYTNSCLTNFTNEGSIGAYGLCYNSYDNHYYNPPGGSCRVNNFFPVNQGTAVVCCK